MADIISKLLEDHRYLLKLLDLIDQELQAMNDGREPDFQLLSEIIDYIEHYSDGFHHPMEDFIYDRLSRHEDICSLVDFLQAEHLKLSEMTRKFRDAVDQLAVDDTAVNRNCVATLGAAFVVTQRHHMAADENTIFPHAVKILTEEDWKQVPEKVAPSALMEGANFGLDLNMQYPSLCAKIEKFV